MESELHKSIPWIYMEVDGAIKHYKVIGSYQEMQWKNKKIFLHTIEVDDFNHYIFTRLFTNQTIIYDDLPSISWKTKTFVLQVTTLQDIYAHREQNEQKIEYLDAPFWIK